MNVTRRWVLKGALLTVVSASTVTARAMAPLSASTIIYDSRLPQSRGWRSGLSHPAIDLAQEHANFWRTLRGTAPRGRVVGLTAWSDLVLVRGLLEEKGLRLRAEARRGALFLWEMA
jgi:hypothetical protein